VFFHQIDIIKQILVPGLMGMNPSMNFTLISRIYKQMTVMGITGDEFTPIYNALHNELGEILRNYFKNGLSNRANPEQLEFDVWSKLWEQARNCNYQPKISNINQYIWGIAHHCLCKWIRDNPPTNSLDDNNPPLAPPGNNKGIANPKLEECLQKLAQYHPDWYTVIILIYFQGYTEREAAKIMDIPPTTVHDYKVKGLKFLAECMKRQQ